MSSKSGLGALRILHIAVYDTPGTNPVDGMKELNAYRWLKGLSDQVGFLCTLSTHRSWFSCSKILRNCYLLTVPTPAGTGTGSMARVVFASPLYALIAVVLCAMRKVDVVLATDTIITGIPAYLTKLLTKTPYAIYLGGEVLEVVKAKTVGRFGASSYGHLLLGIAALIHRKILIEADGVFVVSGPTEAQCTRFGVKKIYRISNFFARELFLPKENRNRNTFVTFLCVSRLSPEKSIETLIVAFSKAISTSPNIKLIVVGDGPSKGRIQKMIQELHLTEKVSLVGRVPHKKTIDYYHNSDVFVLSSLTEGLPIAMLEAMSTGLPVIVSNVGGVCEIVKDGHNGILFHAGNVEQLAKAICYLACDARLRLKMGTEAYCSVGRLYLLDDHFETLSEGLTEIASVRYP